MAATNRPEILDPALLRPGRFDRQVALDRPDIKGREQILRVHAKHLVFGQDVDLAAVAGKTAGLAGADLANIVNEAALHAARKNKTVVEMSAFDEAIDRAITGLERNSRVMTAKERETVAYHEAGHTDEEMRKLLLAAQDRVHQSLTARRRELEALAQELLRHEVVDRATLTRLVGTAGAMQEKAETKTATLIDVRSAA